MLYPSFLTYGRSCTARAEPRRLRTLSVPWPRGRSNAPILRRTGQAERARCAHSGLQGGAGKQVGRGVAPHGIRGEPRAACRRRGRRNVGARAACRRRGPAAPPPVTGRGPLALLSCGLAGRACRCRYWRGGGGGDGLAARLPPPSWRRRRRSTRQCAGGRASRLCCSPGARLLPSPFAARTDPEINRSVDSSMIFAPLPSSRTAQARSPPPRRAGGRGTCGMPSPLAAPRACAGALGADRPRDLNVRIEWRDARPRAPLRPCAAARRGAVRGRCRRLEPVDAERSEFSRQHLFLLGLALVGGEPL